MIVAADESHFADWLALRQAVYTGLDEEFHRREMAAWVAEEGRLCLLAFDEGAAVGFVEASLRNIVDGCLSSPVGYLEGIFVAPAQRGQGLARQLVKRVETWCRDQGCTEMATDAERGHDEALAFHRAMGFVETYQIVEFKKAL